MFPPLSYPHPPHPPPPRLVWGFIWLTEFRLLSHCTSRGACSLDHTSPQWSERPWWITSSMLWPQSRRCVKNVVLPEIPSLCRCPWETEWCVKASGSVFSLNITFPRHTLKPSLLNFKASLLTNTTGKNSTRQPPSEVFQVTLLFNDRCESYSIFWHNRKHVSQLWIKGAQIFLWWSNKALFFF